MAREMQVTPKRIEYARQKEVELFDNLLRIAEKKQDEMCNLIAETINERKEDILQKAERHQFDGMFLPNCEILTDVNVYRRSILMISQIRF